MKDIILEKLDGVDGKVTNIVQALTKISVELTESNRRSIKTEQRLGKIEAKQSNHSKWIFIQGMLLVLCFILLISLIPTL